MPVFLIPLVTQTLNGQPSGQPQSMQISLNGMTYTIKVRWCGPADCWMMDLSEGDDDAIIQGVPLITGADLLGQFRYLDLGFSLLVQSNNNPDAVPTFATLGSTGNLYALTADDDIVGT